MMVREGLWSNAISLVNILISGLVAFGFYSPLTIYLDEYLDGQYTYVLDFVVIWVLFAVTMVICRARDRRRLQDADAIQAPDRSGRRAARRAARRLGAGGVRHGHAAHVSHGQGRLWRWSGETGRCRVCVRVYLARCGLAPLCRNDDRCHRCTGLRIASSQFKAQPWVKFYEDHRTQYETSPSVKVRRGLVPDIDGVTNCWHSQSDDRAIMSVEMEPSRNRPLARRRFTRTTSSRCADYRSLSVLALLSLVIGLRVAACFCRAAARTHSPHRHRSRTDRAAANRCQRRRSRRTLGGVGRAGTLRRQSAGRA